MHFSWTSFRPLIVILVTLIFCVNLPEKSYSQDSTTNSSTKKIDEARRANENAQTEYYRLLSKKINEPPESKTFWQKVTDNPASVLSVLGVIVAAIITLLSFVFNYRSTLRNQKDIQFYEALKRFGDKDSPAIRSSAAGILSQMASEKKYFTTVLNQLIAGLLLEENSVVITSIRDAIKLIIFYNSESSLYALYETNLRLQDAMVSSLAEFHAVLGKEKSSDTLELASSFTGYETKVLHAFTNRYEKQFLARFEEASFIHNITSDKSRERLQEIQKILRLISERLSVNISAITFAIPIYFDLFGKLNPIQKIWWRITSSSESSSINLENAFLVKAYLGYLDCEKGPNYSETTNYDRAGRPTTIIKGKNTFRTLYPFMKGAQLQSANLTRSNIKYWQLANALLDDVTLYGVSNYVDANFDGSNWWMANFYDPDTFTSNNKRWDMNLLDELFHRYENLKTEEAHPSVIDYINSKQKLKDPNSPS